MSGSSATDSGRSGNGGQAVVKEIPREELKAKMDRGTTSSSWRRSHRRHYESTHLPGAINLPYEFIDGAEKVLPDKRGDVVCFPKYKTL